MKNLIFLAGIIVVLWMVGQVADKLHSGGVAGAGEYTIDNIHGCQYIKDPGGEGALAHAGNCSNPYHQLTGR